MPHKTKDIAHYEILPQNAGKYPYSKKDNPQAKKTMDKNPFLNDMVYPSYHDFV